MLDKSSEIKLNNMFFNGGIVCSEPRHYRKDKNATECFGCLNGMNEW